MARLSPDPSSAESIRALRIPRRRAIQDLENNGIANKRVTPVNRRDFESDRYRPGR